MFSIFTFTTIVYITRLLFQWVKRVKLHPLALLQWQGTLLVEGEAVEATGWQSTSRNKIAAEFPRIKRTEKNPAHTCTCELVFVVQSSRLSKYFMPSLTLLSDCDPLSTCDSCQLAIHFAHFWWPYYWEGLFAFLLKNADNILGAKNVRIIFRTRRRQRTLETTSHTWDVF